LSLRPGWRNDLGTQQGAKRSNPPLSSKAASTNERMFFSTVLSKVTVFID
jgi:hypothetical protein